MEDLARAVDRTHMALAHGCAGIGNDVVSQCGAVVKTVIRECELSDTELEEVSDNGDNDQEFLDDPEFLGLVPQYSTIRDNIESKVPPCELYLKGLLDPARCGLPGRDLFQSDFVSVKRASQCKGHYHRCGCYDNWETGREQHHRSMNNLVFDFDKRSMTITDWNAGLPCDDLQLGLDDPVALWEELDRQIVESGLLVNAFKRYSVGLREVLQDADHSIHHAGGCGCMRQEAMIQLEMQQFDGHDHATRVLIAVGAPTNAFGRTLKPGDVLAWTIYHGYAAL